MQSNSQAGQDIFVLAMTGSKRNGTFLEIGSNDAIKINNSYLLESKYDWTGIMVEYHAHHLYSYKDHRKNSYWVIDDATKVDYEAQFKRCNMPSVIDYLQIDLEVENESTLKVLELLDKTVMNTHTFATVTFEHDIYRGDFFDTRKKSREIFERRGYVRVFSDVKHDNFPFEDWYVHPSVIPNERYEALITDESMEYTEVVKRLKN